MTLQSSGIMSLDDIYNEAVTGGYTGGRNIQDLRNEANILWAPAVPQSPEEITMPDDFYGKSAYKASSLGTYTGSLTLKNSTGSYLPLNQRSTLFRFSFDWTDEEGNSRTALNLQVATPIGLNNGASFVGSFSTLAPIKATNGNISFTGLGCDSLVGGQEWDYVVIKLNMSPFSQWQRTANYSLVSGTDPYIQLAYSDYTSMFDAIYTSNKTFDLNIEVFKN